MAIITGEPQHQSAGIESSTVRLLPDGEIDPQAWWEHAPRLKRAQRMTRQAERGLRRPFHIFIATDRKAPVGQVVDSFIRATSPSKLLSARTPSGRPLVRWTLILGGDEASRLDRSREEALVRLVDAGVEVQLLRKSTERSCSGISSARMSVIEEIRRMPFADNPILLWLDDDLAFDVLIPDETGVSCVDSWSFLHEVWQFHDDEPTVHIGLGDVTGAPPLPASSTLRSNLLDLVTRIEGLPAREDSNRWEERDYYYDLSEQVRHGSPWILSDEISGLTQEELLHRLLVVGCLGRPLVATGARLTQRQPERYVRGGNTIIFDRRWIEVVDHPPLLRRGDTLWSQMVLKLGGRPAHFPIPLRHLRDSPDETRAENVRASWLRRLESDLVGASIQRWFSQSSESPESALNILHHRIRLHKRVLEEARELASRMAVPPSEELVALIDASIATLDSMMHDSNILERDIESLSNTFQNAVQRLDEMKMS